jgi:hypothetical protein
MNAKAVKNKGIYFNYLSLCAQSKELVVLDATDARLLDNLGLAWSNGKVVSGLDATHILPEISISNAHMRMQRLRRLGLLNLRIDDADNRRKFVEPTDASNKYFAQRTKLMEKAAAVK